MNKRGDSEGRKTREHAFREELTPGETPREHLTLRELRKVRLQVSAELGQTQILVRDVLELREGSIIPLNKLAGEMADIYVNDVPLARGEVVVLVDSLHVRISEIIGTAERESGDA